MKDLTSAEKRPMKDKKKPPAKKKKQDYYESHEDSDSSGAEGGFFKASEDESDDLDSSMIDDIDGFGESQPILPPPEEDLITENDDEAEKRERHRRRSSNMRRRSSGISRSDLNTSIAASHLDGDALKKIYSSSIELFQNKQINPANAFNLKLIDVLDQVIKKGDFTDMNAAGRLLEINIKIFSCRVMNTNNEVLRLASYIASNGKHKDGQVDSEEINQDENEDPEPLETQIKEKKKRVKKIHKSEFKSNIETNLNKITMNMNMVGMSSNAGRRRLDLKKDFTGLIKSGRNFNYIDYFQDMDKKKNDDKIDSEVDDETPLILPNNIINHEDLSHIPFLPFNRTTFDPETDNVWGFPLTDADRSELNETNDVIESIIPAPDPACVYNPEFLNAEDERLDGDDMGYDDDMDCDGGRVIECNQGDPDLLDITKVTSLDQIEDYFYRLSSKDQNIFGRGGWKGPNFTRRLVPPTVAKKRKRKEDEPSFLDFSKVRWKEFTFKSTKDPVHFDEETIGMWQYRPKGNKYKDTIFDEEDENEEEYTAPFRFLPDGNLNKKEYVDPLFRFILEPDWDIFDILKAKHGKLKKVEPSADGERYVAVEEENQPSQTEEDGFYPLEGFDIESIRVDEEDYCGSNGLLRESQGLSLPQTTPGFPTFTDDMQLGTVNTELDTLKHDKKPKIVDMHKLKAIIFNYLKEVLNVEETGKANSNEDRMIPLTTLLFWILNNRIGKIEKNVTIHIAITAIMYLLAEKGLFLQNVNGEDTLIARGKNWVHFDHIPFAGDIREDF